MTFPSNQKPKCQDHEEIDFVLSFTDKYGIEHEHIQNICLNCTDQITFETSDLRPPELDVPTLEAAIAFLGQRKPSDPRAIISKQAYTQCISDLGTLKRRIKHPEFPE